MAEVTDETIRIEKPEAGQFAGKRKLLVVPLLYTWKDAPSEYGILFDIYWTQVREHLGNLESRLGRIDRVFHESIAESGDEALQVLEKFSPATFQIAGDKLKTGATIEATEDETLLEEAMDWERHLMMGFMSERVARVVSGFFDEVSKKRHEHMARRIDEAFRAGEVAVLFIREGHRVQFPTDIEVFSVSPPALDRIHRWLRDYKPPEEKTEQAE
jgi:hypothetical protein